MSKAADTPPDEVLVVAAILGDLDAFNELALRYRAAVVRTAAAVTGRDDAEDVAQDALLLAFKALPSIEDPTHFAAWLMAITRNRALRFDHRKRRRQRGRIDMDVVLLEHMTALNQPMLTAFDVSDTLRRALDRLPDDYALVLRLRFLDEMPLKRIAAFLGVPLSTVKWRIHRGKQLMRDAVERLEKTRTPWKEN